MSEFAGHPLGLTARVAGAHEWLTARMGAVATRPAARRRVAASVAYLGLAARLLSPALGTALTRGVVPDLSWYRLRWRATPVGELALAVGPVGGQPLAEPGDTARADGIRRLTRTTVVPVLDLGSLVGRLFGVSGRIIRGNAASALVGALVEAARSSRTDGRAAIGLATELMRQPELTGAGSFRAPGSDPSASFRRRSCCLLYRVPGSGFCGDCVLRV